ncbi:MAG TPA: DUF4404 family protein [Steroidobacteraceae bacterium]|nr:DUF4404 family protein [Steroidobacteraceae bacterium]
MDAESDSLQRSLTRLRAELARAHRLDEKSRQMLRAALTDIEIRLREKSAAAAEAAAPHGLDALAVGFEADHPSLAASLRQFIELLGQAGL